jgi:Ser/Thr protein kinase RdoA (MazF antagonist)
LLSAAWKPPANFTRPRLDADGLLGAQPLWGRFWEHPALDAADRRIALAVRQRLHARLAGLGRDPACHGVIHADLHPENLVVGEGGLSAIDFDDAAHGWYHYDIAVTLEPCQDRADYTQLRAALLAEYRALRAFDAADERLLDDFLLVRGLALVGWYLQRPEVEAAEPELFAAIRNRTLRQCRAAAPPAA